MVKAPPIAFCSRCSTDSPKEWKVETVSPLEAAPLPCSCMTACARSAISPAALLVKVIARIAFDGTPRSTRRPIRWVMTRVLPDPAPASTRRGPFTCSTASACAGFSGMAGGRPDVRGE